MLFFLQNSTQNPSLEAFIIIMDAKAVNISLWNVLSGNARATLRQTSSTSPIFMKVCRNTQQGLVFKRHWNKSSIFNLRGLQRNTAFLCIFYVLDNQCVTLLFTDMTCIILTKYIFHKISTMTVSCNDYNIRLLYV